MQGIHVQMHADKKKNMGRGWGAICLMHVHVPAQVLIVNDRVLVIHTREMQLGNKIISKIILF